jgi:hypothetical protein
LRSSIKRRGERFLTLLLRSIPAKRNINTRKAKENDLPLPEFNQNQPSKGKIIESINLKEKLGYTFKQGLW